MKNNFNKWLNFVNPENLKDNLTFCSLYIMLYETTTDYIIQQVKDFYITGYDDDLGFTIDAKKYKKDVLSKDKNVLNASLLWFKNADAINQDSIVKFSEIRKYRNILVHEMLNNIFEGLDKNFVHHFFELVDFRIGLERWWFINIEHPTSDNDNNEDFDEDSIITLTQVLYRIIMDIISGNKNSEYYYKEFVKYKERERITYDL